MRIYYDDHMRPTEAFLESFLQLSFIQEWFVITTNKSRSSSLCQGQGLFAGWLADLLDVPVSASSHLREGIEEHKCARMQMFNNSCNFAACGVTLTWDDAASWPIEKGGGPRSSTGPPQGPGRLGVRDCNANRLQC